MTLFKHFVGHHGQARTPLTSLILREGIVVCFLIFGKVIFSLSDHLPETGPGMMVINVTDGGIRTTGLRLGDADFAYVLFVSKSRLSTKHDLYLLGGTYLYFP